MSARSVGSPRPDREPLSTRLLLLSLLPPYSSGRLGHQRGRATPSSAAITRPPRRCTVAPWGLLGRESFPGFHTEPSASFLSGRLQRGELRPSM